MTWQSILLAVAIFLICLFVSWYSILQLRRNHGADIRVVWYFVSLALVVALGIGWWAVDNGALGQHGTFVGPNGEALKKFLDFMLDLNTDLKILAAIVLLITVPQLLGYVLSGLSGSAAAPLLIEGSLSFFVWGLVKAFAVCAGIIFSLAILGMWQGWHTWWPGGFAMTYTSLMLVMLSFATLLMYREAETVSADLHKYFPKLVKPFIAIHSWFTRKERDSQ
jgi:hypothetical protein